jgi:anti-sigma B factor antagonist
MDIIREENGTELNLKIAGRLDAQSVVFLENEISGMPEQVNKLTIDMESLDYISSAGLRVILSAHKKMSKKNGLIIKNVNDMIMEIFNMTGFSAFLTIDKL